MHIYTHIHAYMAAADPGGGALGARAPPPPPFIYKFITFRAAFYTARLRCLLISARMNSTTVLYPGPPDTRPYSPPRPSYRARNRQHPPPPPPPPPPLRSSFLWEVIAAKIHVPYSMIGGGGGGGGGCCEMLQIIT